MRRIVLGTRGSDLARAQTALVQAALQAVDPEIEIGIEIIRTSGDEKSGQSETPMDPHAGRKGMFTAEIERALLSGTIDVAVHSAKDLPSDASEGLEVCAALPRAPVEDLLIAKDAQSLNELSLGATVGTGSVRRQHQLRCCRADLIAVDLRGNVPTRLRKLAANHWDAIILARAGLERLGFDCSRDVILFEEQRFRIARLPLDDFLPAGGQGVVALQLRREDQDTRRVVMRVNHPETLLCLRAEREFLRLIQGDCGTPVGVLGTFERETMMLRAQVFAAGQRAEGRASARPGHAEACPSDDHPEEVAAALFRKMYAEKS